MKYITSTSHYNPLFPQWINEIIPDAVVREINPLAKIFTPPTEKEFTIYYTGENDYDPSPNKLDLKYCDDYPVNMRVGFDPDGTHENYIRIPLWVFYYYEESMKYYSNKEREYDISFVAGHSAKGLRSKIANSMDDYGFKVGYFGKFHHNDDFMLDNDDDKAFAISHSYFNVCPENSSQKGYITEKIFEALWAGCIPIYWGDNDLEPIINKDKVIIVNPDEPWLAFDKVYDLLHNKSKLDEVMSLPPFNNSLEELIQDYKKRFQALFSKLYIEFSNKTI